MLSPPNLATVQFPRD